MTKNKHLYKFIKNLNEVKSALLIIKSINGADILGVLTHKDDTIMEEVVDLSYSFL